tara:strand:+ start:68312 stop:69475 length:1164 start_codon:yes stop_codon:yes gene_type:complete
LHSLVDPATGDLLDRALVLGFRGPQSATGEDVVEWHCHGGQAVVRAVLAALAKLPVAMRVREAEPGEFTRRAFENGRIDLNEAEGLADLLSAETESQRRSALLMAEGHFSRRLDAWRVELLRCAAQTESLLDFSDEDDVPETGTGDKLRRATGDLAADMRAQLAAPSAERLNEGIRVVLAGPPNAGKSTLLNALAGRDAAIVSDIAGTTRDRIDVVISLGGIAFTVTDTAGLAEASADRVERIGVDLARQAIAQCDILLWLGDPEECPRGDAIKVAAQMDRSGWALPAGVDIAVSAVTGENMQALVDRLVARAAEMIPAEGSYALHRRQRDGVARMADALDRAAAERDLLIVAEHLRACLGEMDRLMGKAGVEDMLDSLFSRFCIGK